MLSPDLTAHLQSLAPHATAQLRLQERMASALKGLRLDDAASRTTTALALTAINAELGHLAMSLTARRPPGQFAAAAAAHLKAIQQLRAAADEMAGSLKGDSVARVKRLEAARARARDAETSMRGAANAISAGIGAAAAVLAGIPIVGPIFAAILLLIAAVIVLIGQIIAKALEDQAAEKEKEAPGSPKPKRASPWPP
jgi:hypothetical protein